MIDPSPREIKDGRAWIADCEWADLDPREDDVAELTARQVVRGINQHYDGGWDQFIRDGGYE